MSAPHPAHCFTATMPAADADDDDDDGAGIIEVTAAGRPAAATPLPTDVISEPTNRHSPAQNQSLHT